MGRTKVFKKGSRQIGFQIQKLCYHFSHPYFHWYELSRPKFDLWIYFLILETREFWLLQDGSFDFSKLTYSVLGIFCLPFASACENFETQLLSLVYNVGYSFWNETFYDLTAIISHMTWSNLNWPEFKSKAVFWYSLWFPTSPEMKNN